MGQQETITVSRNGHKRAVIYARVSSDEQVKGYGLPTQLEACRKYAEQNDFTIVAEVTDDYTGAELEREGLDQVRAMVERREIDAVIDHAADRLTRNLAHSLLLREEFREAGIELHHVARGKSEDTAEGRLTENIEGVIAEYEREKIKERTRRGRLAKAESGKWVGGGPVPYGYKRVGARREAQLVIDDYEAQVVHDIFGKYATGRYTTAKIAVGLIEATVPPPGRGRRGSRGWWGETIGRMLRNPRYIGVFKFKGITIALPELTIIDRTTWAKVQDRLKRNKDLAPRNRRYYYLLSGVLYCSCGHRMSGGINNHGDAYYRCYSKVYGHTHLYDCKEGYLRADVLDGLVWDWLLELLTNSEEFDKGLQRMAERRKTLLEPKRKRLDTVNGLIAKLEAKVQRLVSELADIDDPTVRDAVKSELKTITKQKEALGVERDTLLAELGQSELSEEVQNSLKTLADELREKIHEADYKRRRYIVDKLDVRAQLRHDDTGRYLDVTAGIRITGVSLRIDKPVSRR